MSRYVLQNLINNAVSLDSEDIMFINDFFKFAVISYIEFEGQEPDKDETEINDPGDSMCGFEIILKPQYCWVGYQEYRPSFAERLCINKIRFVKQGEICNIRAWSSKGDEIKFATRRYNSTDNGDFKAGYWGQSNVSKLYHIDAVGINKNNRVYISTHKLSKTKWVTCNNEDDIFKTGIQLHDCYLWHSSGVENDILNLITGYRTISESKVITLNSLYITIYETSNGYKIHWTNNPSEQAKAKLRLPGYISIYGAYKIFSSTPPNISTSKIYTLDEIMNYLETNY